MEAPPPAIADNMILAMFVDSGQAALLANLAGGTVHVSPSILDPDERPPFPSLPGSEFVRGLVGFQGRGDAISAQRHIYRLQYISQRRGLWTPVEPTLAELRLANHLASKDARTEAKKLAPELRMGRADPGEAECAAIAVTRGWRLWSDDAGIVTLVRALYPTVQVERTCALVAQAVNQGLLNFSQGQALYQDVFKARFGLHTPAVLVQHAGVARCVIP